jgi:hypothetical protein
MLVVVALVAVGVPGAIGAMESGQGLVAIVNAACCDRFPAVSYASTPIE